MSDRGRRSLTGIVAAVVVAVLMLGGGMYVWSVRNGENLSERNLRELSRMGRAIEGQVNNLHSVLGSLAQTNGSAAVRDRAALIPNLSMPSVRPCGGEAGDAADAASTTITQHGLDSLRLRLSMSGCGGGWNLLTTGWGLDALRPTLVSDYFELTLLTDDSTAVLLSVPESSGIRVQSLPLPVDSLGRAAGGPEAHLRGSTTIHMSTIGGRSYRVFVQPLTIRVGGGGAASADSLGASTRWYVAGLVPESRFRQEQIALGPSAVLTVGLALILGLLALPFVRATTMGPRERLRVRHLLMIVISLVLMSGAVGIGLADIAYFEEFHGAMHQEMEHLADSQSALVEAEVDDALRQLDDLTARLNAQLDATPIRTESDRAVPSTDAILMKTGLPWDSLGIYPGLTMAFWAGPDGQQMAKWTPRANNTPRVRVAGREYFNAIREGREWTRPDTSKAGSTPYYIESIRTWTTGEKSAAISRAWVLPDGREGVAVLLTTLASLDQPVLPPGVSFAVVDSGGNAVFHARKERVLEENLIDEADGDERLRATLTAQAKRDMDVVYRGRHTRLFVRPLQGTPLSLILMLDEAQLGTLHFETVFLSGALLASVAVLIMAWLALVELVVPRKMHWVWPDPSDPGKYLTLSIVLALFIVELVLQAMWTGHRGPSLTYLFVPFQALGLGLVVLSITDTGAISLRKARGFGWFLTLASTVLVVSSQIRGASGVNLESVTSVLIPIVLTLVAAGVVGLEYSIRRPWDPRERLLRGVKPRWEAFQAGVAKRPMSARLYQLSMVLGLLLVGTSPGYLLYQTTFERDLNLLVRFHQVEFVAAMNAREVRLDAVEQSLGAEYRAQRADKSYDFVSEGRPLAISNFECGPAPVSTVASPDTLPTLADALADRVPLLSETAVKMRELGRAQPNRSWGTASSYQDLRDGDRCVSSSVAANVGEIGVAWWLLLLAGGTFLAWIVGWVSRRVFLIEVRAAPSLTLDDVVAPSEALDHTMVLCTRSMDRGPLDDAPPEWEIVDLMDSAVDVEGAPSFELSEDRSVLCLDHFDHRIGEPAWSQALLARLEEVVNVEQGRRRVVLLSSREPSDLFGDDSDVQDAHRWTRLLGQFARVAVRDSSDGGRFEVDLWAEVARIEAEHHLSDGSLDRIASLLMQECSRPPLRRIALHILETWPAGGMTDAELIRRLRDEAATYYEALWAVLGDEDKLVLAQIASGSSVNPSCGNAVTRLLTRQILVRAPELRVMNDSFELFIRDKTPESQIVQWELAGAASTWELIRLPFIAGWLVLAIFLSWTQRDLVGNTVAFLSTAGVGLAAVIRLLTVLYGGTGQAAKESAKGS